MYYILGSIYTFTIISEIVCIIILLLKGERNLKTYLFLGCIASSLLWGMSQIGIFGASNEIQFYISYIVGNVGVCFIGTFWVNFIFYYTEHKCTKFLYTSFGISALFYLAMLTNPLHHMYYKMLEMGAKEHAFLFKVNKYYIYFCVILGVVTLLKHKTKTRFDKLNKNLIVSFVTVPFGLNLLQHFEIVVLEAELTPLSFSIACIFVFVAIFKYEFLNINKLVFEDIIRDINEGVIVFSRTGRLSYINNAAKQDLGQIESLDDFYTRFAEHNLKEMKDKEEITLVRGGEFIQIQKIIKTGITGEIVSVSFLSKDVTKFYQLIEQSAQISQLEQELVIEQERNDIVQKVHDTLGHSLTVIHSLIKLGVHSIDKPQEAQEYLLLAKRLTGDGLKELREYINATKKNCTKELLNCSIKSLVDTIKEVPIELSFVGTDDKKYLHLKETIFLCVRELITNCLKYANASGMQIIIKYMDEGVEIFVCDDGVGCDNIVFGNGLLGIKERITKARGEFRANSEKDEGFQVYISLPV